MSLVIQRPLTSVSVMTLYVFSMWAFSASRSLSVAKGKATSNLPAVSGEDSKAVVDGATWSSGSKMLTATKPGRSPSRAFA